MNIKTTEYSNTKTNHSGTVALVVITVVVIAACFAQLTRIL